MANNENYEVTTTEDCEVVTENYGETEECSGGGFGKVLGVGLIIGLGAAGVAAFRKKIQPKLEARKIKKDVAFLESKGYSVQNMIDAGLYEVEEVVAEAEEVSEE